jgi:PKD repeat protein
MRTLALLLCLAQTLGAAVTGTISGQASITGKAVLSGNGVFIAPPVAAFNASTTAGDPTLSVTFTDASTGTPTSWFWNFGDGNTSTSQNPTHGFASGLTTVTFTAQNAGGSSSTTTNIVVNYLADIFVDFHGGTSGQAVTTNLLAASSYISTSFKGTWTLLGGQTATNLPTSTAMFFTNVNAALPAPVKVDGTAHDGANGVGMAYFFNGAFEQYGVLNWATNYPTVSFQCIMSFGEANGNFFDHGVMESTTNASVYCSFPNYHSGLPALRTETCPSPNPCVFGSNVTISRNTNYRVVGKWVSGDGGYINFYDMSGNLVGSTYSSNDSIAGGVALFQLGIPSSSDGGNTVAFWDSLAIKFDGSLYQ